MQEIMGKYFKMLEKIEKENINITKLYLLSCLDTSDKVTAVEQMEYCYNVWIEADVDMDLARLADIVREYWEAIQKDEKTDKEIIEDCLDI